MKVTHRVRCRRCRKRRNLSMHPGEYQVRQRCPSCRAMHEWAIDGHRQSGREGKRQKTCRCDGMFLTHQHEPWPHRFGSVGCLYHEPDQEEE